MTMNTPTKTKMLVYVPPPRGLGPGDQIVVGVDGREERVEVGALHPLDDLGDGEPGHLCVCLCARGGSGRERIGLTAERSCRVPPCRNRTCTHEN
jgi:hypothetical protein